MPCSWIALVCLGWLSFVGYVSLGSGTHQKSMPESREIFCSRSSLDSTSSTSMSAILGVYGEVRKMDKAGSKADIQ